MIAPITGTMMLQMLRPVTPFIPNKPEKMTIWPQCCWGFTATPSMSGVSRSTLMSSIKAFFSGYKLVAVVAMVPVIEGIVRKMASRASRDIGFGFGKLKVEFDHIVERERTSPNCYGERLVMLEVLRDFIRERFLESTDKYDGLNHFNRHGIVHGIYDEYGVDLNFFRLITLLDLLCFSIGMIEGGPVFAPETTPESFRLAQQYHWLQQNVSASQSHWWWRRFLNLLSGRRPPQPPLRRSTIS